jgi:hypothetical protein
MRIANALGYNRDTRINQSDETPHVSTSFVKLRDLRG